MRRKGKLSSEVALEEKEKRTRHHESLHILTNAGAEAVRNQLSASTSVCWTAIPYFLVQQQAAPLQLLAQAVNG